MLNAKRKITKRELKQDALITSYMKATSFFEQNKKNVQVGLTALVVLIIASVAYMNNQRSNNEAATAELGKVYAYYDNSQYQLAIDGVPERNIRGLKSVVEEYGGTRAGEMARFYLANAYFQLGRYDEALENFEEFSGSDPLLEASRLSGIAACHEAKGNHPEAAEYFEKAATKYPKDPNAAENLHHAARNYGLAGQKGKAVDLFKKLKKEYPTSTFAREADRYIAQFSA